MTVHRNRGAAAMLAGVVAYSTNDALIKLASEAVPSSQIVFVRSLWASVFLIGIGLALQVPIHLKALLNRWVVLRSALETFSSVCFVACVAHLPLANAVAIFMVTPIISTLLAIVFVREQVGIRHWAAIIAGFVGVLLIVQPAGDEFNAWSLLVLFSSFLAACRDIVTRSVSRDVSSLSMSIFTLAVMSASSGLWGTSHAWQPLTMGWIATLAAAGVLVGGGFYLTTVAMRVGEIRVVAPLRYAGLIISTFTGWIIWKNIPNGVAVCGMVLTVLSGTWLVRMR